MDSISPRSPRRAPLAPVNENMLNTTASDGAGLSAVGGKPASLLKGSADSNAAYAQVLKKSTSPRVKLQSAGKTAKEFAALPSSSTTTNAASSRSTGAAASAPHTRIYSVAFPPGNMGLDLEPLLVSLAPERLTGCKVKGFYFALEHTGITEEELTRHVSVGDIIARIGDKDVLFSKFEDILDMLRNLKRETRTISFKTISYDDQDANATVAISPSYAPSDGTREYESTSASGSSSKKSSPAFSTPTKSPASSSSSASSRRIDVSMLSPSQEVSSLSLMSCSPSTPMKNLQTASPLATGSPALADGEHRVAAIFSPSSVKQMMKAKTDTLPVSEATPSEEPRVTDNFRVDVSSDSISIGSLHSSVDMDEGAAVTATQPRQQLTTAHGFPRRRLLGSNLGTKIVHVGSVLGHSVLAAATVVSQSAERIMETAIPMYSEEQMDDVMGKKDTLLRELSQTCMMLGVSEQRQKDLENQLNMLRHTEERIEDSRRVAEDRYRLACSRFEEASLELAAVQADRDAWSARAHAAETEMEDMRAKMRSSKDTIVVVKSELESSKSLLQSTNGEKAKLESSLLESERNVRDLQVALAEVKADLDSERSAHIADTSAWNMQFDRMDEEQLHLREELKSALDEAAQRFRAVEGQRDDALKECDILKELMETYRIAHEAEMSRMKENVSAQQQWQKERFKERDDEISRLRHELEISNARAADLSEQLVAKTADNVDLNNSLLRAEAETAVVTHAARSLESKLMDVNEEKQALESLMKSTTSEKISEIARFREELLNAQSANISASEQCDELKAQIFEMDSSLRSAEETNQSLSDELRNARAEFEESNENWKQVISLLRVQMDERETELRNATQCIQESARIQVLELKASLDDLSNQVAAGKIAEDKLQDEILSYKQFFACVVREIKIDFDMSSDFDYVVSQIAAQTAQISELISALEVKDSDIADKTEKIQSLVSELGQVNSELATAKVRTATSDRDHSAAIDGLQQTINNLKAQLLQQKGIEASLQEKYDWSEEELASVQYQFTHVSSECELLRHTNREKDVKLDSYVSEIKTLTDNLESREEEIVAIEETTKSLAAQNAELSNKLLSLESSVEAMDNEMLELQSRLQCAQDHNQALEESSSGRGRALDAKESEINRLSNACKSLQSQCEDLNASLKSRESELHALQSSINSRDSTIDALRAEIKALEDNAALLSSQLDSASEMLLDEKHSQERNISSLNRTIENLTAKLNASERNNSRLRDEIASLVDQLNASITNAAELEVQLIESSNKIILTSSDSTIYSDKLKKFTEKIANLEESLAQERSRTLHLSNDLSEKYTEILHLQQSLSENQSAFASQLGDANKEALVSREQIDSLKSDLDRQSENLIALTAEISSLQDTLGRKEASIDSLKKINSAAVAKYAELVTKLRSKFSFEISSIRTDIDKLRDLVEISVKDAKAQSSNDAKSAFDILFMKLSESQSKVASLQASVVLAKDQIQSTEQLSQERIQTYDGAVEQLERDVSELHLQLAKSNHRVRELENQITESSNSKEHLFSRAEQKRQSLVEEYEAVIEGLRGDRAALIRKMEGLCEKISNYQDQIAELLVDRDNFAQKCAHMADNESEIRSKIHDLEDENRRLQDRLHRNESKSFNQSQDDAALESLRKDRAALYSALDEARKENDNLKEKLIQSSKDIREFHSLLEKAEEQLILMEKERQTDLDKFQKRILEFDERETSLRMTLEQTMENYRVDRSSLISSYEAQLSNQSDDVLVRYQNVVDKLRNDLVSFESLREQWVAKEKSYETEIDNLKSNLKQARDDLKEKSKTDREVSSHQFQLNTLRNELKESQDNCSVSLSELQKLRKDHDLALKELRLSSENAAKLKLSLDKMEQTLRDAQSVESILRLRLSESETKITEMECVREENTHDDQKMQSYMEQLLEENSAFAICIEEFETKFAFMDNMLKDGAQRQAALVDECSRLEALVHAKDQELESALLRYQTLAADACVNKSQSIADLQEKVTEITENYAKMQFDYMQVRSELNEKRKEVEALRSVSAKKVGSMHAAASDLVLQSRWRDDLWTQGLELQSAVTDLTNIIRAIESGLRAVKPEEDARASPSSDTEAIATGKTRLSTRLRIKIENKKHLMYREVEDVNHVLSNIMERLMTFQTTLLTPPWEDKTVEQATEELLKGKLVELKRGKCTQEKELDGLKREVIVSKAIIKMLVRVMRKKTTSSHHAVGHSNVDAAVVDNEVPLDYSMDCGADDDVVNYSRTSVWDISSDEEINDGADDDSINPILGFN